MNTEHAKSQRCELVCMHCEQEQTIAPMPVACLVDVVRGFLLMHRRCEKPVEPSKQVQLFDEQLKREIEAQEIAADGGNGSVCSVHEYEPIDGATDSPAPEIDPPKDMFRELYPMATNVTGLRAALKRVLSESEFKASIPHELPPPSLPLFHEIAHWARTELARNECAERRQRGEPGFDGLYIPTCRMPDGLSAILNPPKAKRGARPLANPKPKKRRSGSTANSS